MRSDRFLFIAILAVVSMLAAVCIVSEISEDSDAATCSTCGGSGEVSCSSCGGKGYTSYTYGETYHEDGCSSCGGSGEYEVDEAGEERYDTISYGSGSVSCSTCGGSGTVADPHTHSYSVTDRDYGDCSGCVYTYTCSCGASYTSGTKYDSHSYSLSSSTSGECHGTEKTYKCSRCGDTYTSGTAYDHSYTSKVTKAATCTSAGTRTYTCSYCGDSYTSTISKTSHSYTYHSAVSATCTSDGNAAYYTCSSCGGYFTSSKVSTTWSALKISATGHSYGSWTTTKAATCEATGTQSHTCSKCSNTETQTIAATGHSYVNHAAVAATCTASGNSQYYTCSNCSTIFNSSKTVISSIPTIAATGHSYTSKVTTAATCTSTGVRTYTCSNCSTSYTETIEKISHSYTYHSAVSATCTTSGNAAYYTCSSCGGYFTSSKVSTTWSALQIAATGHSYVNHAAVAATCTASGNSQYYTCSNCSTIFNSSKTVISSVPTIAALGHSYSASGYSWASDYSSCTVSFKCSNDSSHTASCSVASTSSTTKDSDVRSHTVYTVSGTDSATKASYSSSKTIYTHTAILKYDLLGGSGTFSDQTASYTSESSSPSGSKTFTLSSTQPIKSDSVFFGWAKTSGGSIAAKEGGSVSVPYGSSQTMFAVFEDILQWTSVPTASCVVQAVYSYNEDGSYIITNSRSDASAGDLVLSSPMTIGADAWTDPNYREPPAADHVINVTDDLSFKSNDPAYTITWSLTDTSGSDSDRTAIFAVMIALAKSGFYGGNTYTYTSEECLPSWITWDATATTAENGVFILTIRPALQQVSEDTHGDYWIWFSIVDRNNIGGKAETTTYLVKFDVDVSWAGGVIVPENYSMFVLRLDFGLPNGMNNITLRQQLSADAEEYRFPIKEYTSVRDGYTFKGWSLVSGSPTTDVGDEFPLNINSASTMVSVDDDGNRTYTVTLYAVWEKDPEPEPSIIPDFFQDLLDLLSDPYVLGLFVLIVFGLACIVRVRRQGMM